MNKRKLGHVGRGLCSRGQVTTETLLLAPVFFLLVFGALQLAHVGLGVALVHYATSSVARQAVQNNTEQIDKSKFENFMIAGLQAPEVRGSGEQGASSVLKDLTVVGCAKLPAYPFVGQTLKAAWKGDTSDGCSENAP